MAWSDRISQPPRFLIVFTHVVPYHRPLRTHSAQGPDAARLPREQIRAAFAQRTAASPDRFSPASRALLRLHGRRPIRVRRYLRELRPGHGAGVPHLRPALLEHPHLVRRGGAQQHSSRTGRLLPLEPRRIRRLLGIPVRLVELDGNLPTEQPLWRAADGLPERLLPVDHGQHKMGRSVPRTVPALVSERARNPGGRMAIGRTALRGASASRVAVHRVGDSLALQSRASVHAAGQAIWRGVRQGTGAGDVELRGLRAALQHDRRDEGCAAHVRATAGVDHAAQRAHVCAAHDAGAGRARQLAGVEDRLHRHRFAADRRTLAGRSNAGCGDDRHVVTLELDHSLHHQSSGDDGRGRISSRVARKDTSALRNTGAGDRGVRRCLLRAGSLRCGRPGEHLYLDADCDNAADAFRGLAHAPESCPQLRANSEFRAGKSGWPTF